MNKTALKKVFNVISNVVLYIFLAVCIISVLLTLLSRRDSDGAAEIFGYQMRVVVSDSMSKSEFTDVSEYDVKDIPIRSMIFVKVKPRDATELDAWYRAVEEGDVLTFRYVYTTQVTITHRVTKVTEKPTGGYIIELEGDNKNSEDGQLTQIIDTSIPNNTNYVIGKVVGQARLFGTVMSFLMQPLGIILLIILPCAVIIVLEIVKIARAMTADRRKREKEEKEQRENELEELRRKLAELEKERVPEKNTSSEPKKETTDEIREDKT